MLFTNNGKFLKNNGLLLNDGSGPTPPVDPYNPFNLGPGVLRIRMINAPVDYDPSRDVSIGGDKGYWQKVDTDIWDWVPGTNGLNGDYFNVIRYSFDLMSWNISGFTDPIYYCFRNSKIERIVYPIDFSVMSSVQTCDEMFAHSTLYNVPSLIRLPSNESCWRMFFNCVNLREIPQFDWNYKPSNVDLMFGHCVSVEGGMLNFYNHWNTINSHAQCFNQCGVGTQTGSAELAQIPNDWK
jgi:hypothetical protein